MLKRCLNERNNVPETEMIADKIIEVERNMITIEFSE